MFPEINVVAAWLGFLLGGISGAIPGLFFHDQDWLGGYTSWPRRMIRLGHISFFGIGFLNMSYYGTFAGFSAPSTIAGVLLLLAAVLMPTICYLSAFKPTFRHLFFLPAGSILLATIITLERLVTS